MIQLNCIFIPRKKRNQKQTNFWEAVISIVSVVGAVAVVSVNMICSSCISKSILLTTECFKLAMFVCLFLLSCTHNAIQLLPRAHPRLSIASADYLHYLSASIVETHLARFFSKLRSFNILLRVKIKAKDWTATAGATTILTDERTQVSLYFHMTSTTWWGKWWTWWLFQRSENRNFPLFDSISIYFE